MSSSESHALAAIAVQFGHALALYEQETDELLANDRDMDCYSRFSARMDEMRLYATALPHLGMTWAEVLIRHFELTHGLWKAQREPARRCAVVEIREKHAAAVQSLRRRIERSVARH
jgi:hypothetical protein